MYRRIRRVFKAVAAVVGALGLFLLIGKLYLASSGGGARIAARLEAKYGGPVEVGGVDVGFGHVSLRNVRLFEAGPDPQPWAVIDEVRTDLTPGDLLHGGVEPHHLDLIGAVLTLRFDHTGSLLTRIPSGGGSRDVGDLPEILAQNGRVILRQEGRPDFVVSAVNAELKHEGSRLVLSGQAATEHWGEWSLAGYLVPRDGEASLTLRRPEIHFTQTMLDELPFVPASTWKEVQAEGNMPVEVTVGYDSAKEWGHYRVTVRPRQSRVRVTAIDLEADEVHGEVILEDGHVRLRDVAGRTAEGTIQTSGDLDFHSTPELLKFAVNVDALRLKRLPRSWSLPPLIDGRLTGHADLVVTLGEGKARTNGEGNGIVRDARVVGLPAQPVRLKLEAKGHGFQFAPEGAVKNDAARGGRGEAAKEPLMPLARDNPEPDYAEADLGMNDADLAKLLHNLGVTLPVPVAGWISWHARLSIPLDTARDPKTYQVRGDASLRWARVAELELKDVHTRLDYRDGVLRLEDLAGNAPGPMPKEGGPPEMGRLAGTVRVGMVPSRRVEIRLSVTAMSLGRLLSVVPGLAEHAQGDVSARLEFHAPVARLRDVTTWQGLAGLASRSARVFDWEVTGGRGNFHLDAGMLSGTELAGRAEGVPISASGRLRLTAPYHYEARGTIADNEPTAMQRLARKLEAPVAVGGSFRMTAGVRGNLRPLTVHAEGTAAAPRLEVDGIAFQDVGFRWQVAGDRLDITALRARLFGGETTGDAVIPLTAAPGRATLAFKDVDTGAMVRQLAKLPVRLEGRLSGIAEAHFAAGPPGRRQMVRAELQIQSPRLTAERIPADEVSGSVVYGPGGLDYRLAGLALDGRLFLEGHVPSADAPEAMPHEGLLRVTGASLGRLGQVLDVPGALRPLQGIVDLHASYRQDRPGAEPTGNGRFVLRGLRWSDIEMSEVIRGNLALKGTQLRLQDLSGDLGEGELRGHAAYDFRRNGRGWFNAALERAEATRLLEPWPALRSRFTGPLDIQVRGDLGADWTGSGVIHLPRGTVLGVEVVDARLPFDFEIAPVEGNGQIALRGAAGQVARGRVTAAATYRWGGDARLESRLRFYGVRVQALLHSLGADISQVGTGQLSGQLDLGGTNIQSADDLAGAFQASLQRTQAIELPVVRQLLPFLAPTQSGTAIFTTGDLDIRLARGILRIQRFRLIGPILQMVIEGTATLSGRIDLDVTANTSSPVHAGGAEMLSARVPAVGAIPLRLVAQATSLFAGRLLHLDVTGTWRSPVIRVAPILSLTEEAVRFFLGLATRGASIIASPGGL